MGGTSLRNEGREGREHAHRLQALGRATLDLLSIQRLRMVNGVGWHALDERVLRVRKGVEAYMDLRSLDNSESQPTRPSSLRDLPPWFYCESEV